MNVDEVMAQQLIPPSKRFNSRVESKKNVWVYWECNGDRDVSRVKDLSVGGLFIETPKIRRLGATTDLHFLVTRGTNSIQRCCTACEARRRAGIEIQSSE